MCDNICGQCNSEFTQFVVNRTTIDSIEKSPIELILQLCEKCHANVAHDQDQAYILCSLMIMRMLYQRGIDIDKREVKPDTLTVLMDDFITNKMRFVVFSGEGRDKMLKSFNEEVK